MARSSLITPDTTGHEFIWQKHILGNARSSNIKGVWVFNENNIWAVGRFHFDTMNVDSNSYNLAKWDGVKWKYEKLWYNLFIVAPGAIGDTFHTAPGYSIYAFSENDVWIAAEGLFHWDGRNWTHTKALMDVGFSTGMIGSSSDDMRFINFRKMFFNYPGTGVYQFLRIETDSNIYWIDIIKTGEANQGEGSYFVLGQSVTSNLDNSLYVLDKNRKMTKIPSFTRGYALNSLYYNGTGRYYFAGYGIYTGINRNNQFNDLQEVSINYPLGKYFQIIRGQNCNDIFTAGSRGLISHFNGYTWKVYSELLNADYYFNSIHCNKDIVAIGGDNNSDNGILFIGKRPYKKNY